MATSGRVTHDTDATLTWFAPPQNGPKSPVFVFALLTLAAGLQNCWAQDTSVPIDPSAWVELLTGNDLQGWSRTNFGGEGDVNIVDQSTGQAIQFEFGNPLTGITYKGTEAVPADSLPTLEYELELEASRIAGSDFFCGITFPYKDSHCTLILGGWGGQLIGLSSLNGQDASQNETTDYRKFESGKWYLVNLKVTDGRIEARLDGKQIVTCRVGDRKVTTRPEVARNRPLGLASYQTQTKFRHLRFRRLKEEDQPARDANTSTNQ